MEVDKLLHMTGVDHKASYAKNSYLQKIVLQASIQVIESSIREFMSNSNGMPKCINIAELGCSSGPNAFLATEEIIPIVTKTCHETNQDPPSFQLFLNDLVGNDFNGIFKSLSGFYDKLENGRKTRSCFIAAMPGSFYGRLFPEQSIHFVHSCFGLHWLSQVPQGLVSETGEQLNKKTICFSEATSPPAVYAAYSDQFNKDFRLFLKSRSEEMAFPGNLVLTFICKNNEGEGIVYMELLGNVIHDMVIEGLIEEVKLETLNIPSYFPSIEEVRDAIESDGSFKVRHLDMLKWSCNKEYKVNGETLKFKGEYLATTLRAVFEPILATHFGENFMDDLFCRFGKKISQQMDMGQGNINYVLVSLAKE